MATTTPNYGWPVPTSTDYVKDGATAIEALGDAIDATVFGLPGSGMVLINATTIGTTVASVQIDNCFTSTYANYRIVVSINACSAADTNVLFRLVDGTSPVTTANYEYGAVGLSSSNVTENKSGAAQTSFTLGSTATSYAAFGLSVDIYKPQLAFNTSLTYQSANSYSTGRVYVNNGVARFDLTTQLEGFQILASSGTFTGGTIAVYGYKKQETMANPLLQINDLVREMTDEEYAEHLALEASQPPAPTE